MNKQLIKFYNENKKSVIIFTISIVILFFILFYFNSRITLGCKFQNGFTQRGDYKRQVNEDDITIEINTLFKTVKTNFTGYEFNNGKRRNLNDTGNITSSVEITKNTMEFYNQDVLDKLDNQTNAKVWNTVKYTLNRLTGQLTVRTGLLGKREMNGGEYFFQCSEGNKKF